MNTERLVTMANDIAAFFAAGSDPNAAAEQVTGHLRRFWDPRMRRQIQEHAAQGGAGLCEVARLAVQRLAADKAGSQQFPASAP
jgi:formate dehydrogenase subunit delta